MLLGLSQSVVAVGTTHIYSQCSSPVYWKAVAGEEQAYEAIPSEGIHLPYLLPGRGVSVKLATNVSNSQDVSQFEYTWADGKIYFDLSNIDTKYATNSSGYPFSKYGMCLTPSMVNDPKNPTCVVVDCPAGQTYCDAAYNDPNDHRTFVCDEQADLSLVLCSSNTVAKRNAHLHEHQRRQLVHPHATHLRV